MVQVAVCILCGAKEKQEERRGRQSRRSLCAHCTHLLLRGSLSDPHVLRETMRLIHSPLRRKGGRRRRGAKAGGV